jgi:hypothetical protein
MDIAFAPNGDIYIGEGHGNESPNDVGSGDPANDIGAARIIHLGRDGKFLGQWFGNGVAQGRFSMAWDNAGNVYTGDTSVARVTKMVAASQVTPSQWATTGV